MSYLSAFEMIPVGLGVSCINMVKDSRLIVCSLTLHYLAIIVTLKPRLVLFCSACYLILVNAVRFIDFLAELIDFKVTIYIFGHQ